LDETVEIKPETLLAQADFVRAVVRKEDQTIFKSDFKFLENGKSIEIQVKH